MASPLLRRVNPQQVLAEHRMGPGRKVAGQVVLVPRVQGALLAPDPVMGRCPEDLMV